MRITPECQARLYALAVFLLASMLLRGGPFASPLQADVFMLKCGGQVRGAWLNSDRQTAEHYEIELPVGGRIVLAPDVVDQVSCESPLIGQYRRIASCHADDIAGHLAVAQWCRERGLTTQRREHMQRIVQLDPDHIGARRALGYSFIQGRWITHDQYMSEQGYVRYEGRWQLPQQVQLLKVKRERETAERKWYQQLVRWRKKLGTDHHEQYRAQIRAIRDTDAIAALVSLQTVEASRPVRLLYIETLHGIGTPVTRQCLLKIALIDGDQEVVDRCLSYLQQNPDKYVHEQLLETLNSEENVLVNSAARALRRLGNGTAIDPLIDALVTDHRIPVPGPPTRCGQRPKILVPIAVQNRDVLTTLIALSGNRGYGYDQKAWNQWRYLQSHTDDQSARKVIPIRRDQLF